jgi:hypothetical protein
MQPGPGNFQCGEWCKKAAALTAVACILCMPRSIQHQVVCGQILTVGVGIYSQ